MPRWLIFAAWTEHDTALWNSHWIAQQTARLATTPAVVIERDEAVRGALETALGDETLEGVALFGHGRAHAMMGSDGREALDVTNVKLLGAKWAHVMACHTGREFVPGSAAHGSFLVGYDVALIVEWTLNDLPAALRDLLAHMVTATTLELLAGVRSKTDLQRRVQAAAEEVSSWLLDNTTEGYLGLHIFAQQLVDRMVVSR